MKTSGRVAIILSAMVTFFILGVANHLAASVYLGTVTWTVTITEDEVGPVDPVKIRTCTAAISYVGGSHYELVGNVADPSSRPWFFVGGGVLIGDTLTIALSGAEDRPDGKRETGIFEGQINKTTFNGTGWQIKKRFNTATRTFSDHYSNGTLTVVGSPIPLAPSAVGATSLLLD